MALFNRRLSLNRGMPTLSLQVKPSAKARGGTPLIARWAWGGVCVPLFLFIFVLSQFVSTPLFAQDLRNRTADIFHMGRVIISSESLPDPVYESQKNKILISVLFIEKGHDTSFITSVGTGFVTENPGTIITARHLLDLSIVDAEKIKSEKIKSNPKFDYGYMFMGTIITDKEWLNFPLTLVAVGGKGTLKDVMALKVDSKTMEKAQMVGDTFYQNPLRLLMKTTKFADADIGEKVYISGFAPSVAQYVDKNNQLVPVYADFIDHTFPAEVEAVITDMPGNKTGVKVLYRLRDHAEPGFSGGKVLNSQGQVIGMTVAASVSRNFIYALSSKDIRDFLKENKLK